MNQLALQNPLIQGNPNLSGFGNIYNVKAHGLLGGGADDTAAMQALINLVCANGGGTIYFPDPGPYVIAGALQDTSYRNAQILFPTYPSRGTQVSIVFKGFVKPSAWPNIFSGDFLPNGTIIKSTLAAGSGTRPAVFNGRGNPGSDFDETNGVHVTFEDITFQTVANPSYSCLNLQHMAYTALKDVTIIAGNSLAEPGITEPTTTTSYGIILPDNSRAIMNDLSGQLQVYGFYNGMRWGELTHAKQVFPFCCKVGIEFAAAYHSSLIERFLPTHCIKGAVFTGIHPVSILLFDTERLGDGHWNSPSYEIDDPSNLGSGDVTWLTVLAGVGRTSSFSKNGGTGLHTRELGSAWS